MTHPMDPSRERSFPHRESSEKSAAHLTGSAVLSLGPEGMRLESVQPDAPAKPSTILDEAAALTSGDRQRAYGHPRQHFACTAALVTAYLRRRRLLRDGAALEARDWACLMALDKVSRYAGGRKRDCLVDLAGYARTAEMLGEEP